MYSALNCMHFKNRSLITGRGGYKTVGGGGSSLTPTKGEKEKVLDILKGVLS